MFGGRTRLIGLQQALRQLHAILRGGCQLVGLLRIAQRLARIQCLHGHAGNLANFALQPRFRQIDGEKVHHAPQHGEHEKDQQPIQLTPATNGMDGKKERHEDVQPTQNVRKIKHAKPLRFGPFDQ